ncbi:NAD(P)-binding protein [Aspergillus heteromorphus CBS 117.55]|uniref:NAD(P)-binding protein n=1 Tax=Aspergillus heteromorphus CBS 117.55 TaxID=1448321 RepID=A0A317V6B6_9EURO|nr:NAD(P)-binding protein [Aspergillus heteromorphus CBS 117.55]PWY68477.1 NAD(P)-binding protein [Aspergillus heteromorphus CBS 117.55]
MTDVDSGSVERLNQVVTTTAITPTPTDITTVAITTTTTTKMTTSTPIPQSTRQWILNSKPASTPILTSGPSPDSPPPTFKPTTTPLPALTATQTLLKTLYISNDPAQRGQMSALIDPARLYVPPMDLHAPVRTYTISQVLSSGDPAALAPGTIVLAGGSWSEYSIAEIADCEVLDTEALPGVGLTHFMGSFGYPGLTALYGLREVAKLKQGESLVVSGAAGAVGGMVVQIAKKVLGAGRVIGIAGTEDKCRWVEKLGADVCLNYKKEGFQDELWKETEGFVDVYFVADNVGGEILDLMLLRVKRYGRIAACGTIANYNKDDDPVALKNFYQVIINRINVLGFIIFDYNDHIKEAREELIQAYKDGKLIVDDATETVVEATFEEIPHVWMKLFDGSNTGKLTTKLVG